MIVTTHICNACGLGVRFVNRQPLNADGSLHWDVCKEEQFKVVKAKGRYYETDFEAGYVYKGEKWPTWIKGPLITGELYKPSECDCVPAWEVCAIHA